MHQRLATFAKTLHEGIHKPLEFLIWPWTRTMTWPTEADAFIIRCNVLHDSEDLWEIFYVVGDLFPAAGVTGVGTFVNALGLVGSGLAEKQLADLFGSTENLDLLGCHP